MSNKLVFLGAGNMAEALVSGLMACNRWARDRVVVSDIAAERRTLFAEKFNVTALNDNAAAVAEASVVVLAVKPQMLAEVLAGIRAALPADALVISIAAGITTTKIENLLGGRMRVVRAMPNTPALVGCGVAAICGGHNAKSTDLDTAENLLSATGEVVRVEETAMDAVTAVSGSGPAYIFYLMEAMLEAARQMGLSGDVARKLVYTTVKGSAELIMQHGLPPEELRARVTSKGGTTGRAPTRRRAVADVRSIMRGFWTKREAKPAPDPSGRAEDGQSYIGWDEKSKMNEAKNKWTEKPRRQGIFSGISGFVFTTLLLAALLYGAVYVIGLMDGFRAFLEDHLKSSIDLRVKITKAWLTPALNLEFEGLSTEHFGRKGMPGLQIQRGFI
ncbi:MAG: pyrroline-5-carboxylate reductase, partial [Kiritimatiellaeota bacterium]|nr:pyrroline-5-carboxylate reductase [Kiritimatiellota bacterium]